MTAEPVPATDGGQDTDPALDGEGTEPEAEVRYLRPATNAPDEGEDPDEGEAPSGAGDEPIESDDTGEPEETEVSAAQAELNTTRDRTRAAWAWLATVFTPASGLYTDRQPAIAETVRRARDGSHLPDSGPVRVASQAHGYGHAALVAVLDTVKWLAAHPARLAALTVLVTVALAFPPTRHVAGWLLTPFSWAHAALT